jgi:vacuolar protein-sorting-associated protein 4
MAVYMSFKEKGIEFAKQAVNEDNEGNYEKAFQLYSTSLDYFTTYLKYEKNQKVRDAIIAKVR